MRTREITRILRDLLCFSEEYTAFYCKIGKLTRDLLVFTSAGASKGPVSLVHYISRDATSRLPLPQFQPFPLQISAFP